MQFVLKTNDSLIVIYVVLSFEKNTTTSYEFDFSYYKTKTQNQAYVVRQKVYWFIRFSMRVRNCMIK